MCLEDMSVDRINVIFMNNVIGYFLCCCEVVKWMFMCYGGVGGVIVNVLFGVVCMGFFNEYIDYVVLKGVIDILIKGLFVEVVVEKIRVNCVCLGLIYIDMYVDGGELECVERLKSKILM